MSIADWFRPKWKNSDFKIRISGVEGLTDQALLAEIAQNDEDDVVRRFAVKRIDDQAVLARVAKTDEDKSVREAAVERIHDQVVLASIAKDDRHEYVRKAAVKRIHDQAALLDIATNDPEWGVKLAAAERISNPDRATPILFGIVKNALSFGERWVALKRLCDLGMCHHGRYDFDDLETVARHDDHEAVRRLAVEHVLDQRVLEYIAKNDESQAVRKEAAECASSGRVGEYMACYRVKSLTILIAEYGTKRVELGLDAKPHTAKCAGCEAEMSKEALGFLELAADMTGAWNIMESPEGELVSLREGRCPGCGHTSMIVEV